MMISMINHVSTEVPTTGLVIPSGIKTPPAKCTECLSDLLIKKHYYRKLILGEKQYISNSLFEDKLTMPWPKTK